MQSKSAEILPLSFIMNSERGVCLLKQKCYVIITLINSQFSCSELIFLLNKTYFAVVWPSTASTTPLISLVEQ